MTRRRDVIGATVVSALALLGLAAVLLLRGDDGGDAPPAAAAECEQASSDAARACYIEAFTARFDGVDDPANTLITISRQSYQEGGFLLANCHGIMHTVARAYAREQRVTLATLMNYLPQSNDPGCSAGFAHGLVTAVAPEIDIRDPQAAATVCGEAETRFQRYSCTHGFGHAFMRIYDEDLPDALALCRRLGPLASPDCAQGAYHDYWFAVAGLDDAQRPEAPVTEPRELCGAQPREFVRQCWYRAFLETRPEGFQVESAADLERLCEGLRGLQRAGCVTGASVIGPPDPARQLQICAVLAPTDAANCVRGTKVQNLIGFADSKFRELIVLCELFQPGPRSACYRWLGKTISVVTDGTFGERVCPTLSTPEAQEACRAGARSVDDALITFS
jgi:hypothetical protein